MFAIFHNSIARFRGQILGWGLSLAVLGGYLVLFYDSIVDPAIREQYEQLLASFPPELFAFFGDVSDLFSPGGYLNIDFFSYMPIVLGIFAVLAGSGLLVAEEESGLLDLVLAHPVSRAGLYFGKVLAFLAATAAILFLAWIGFIVILPGTTMELTVWEMALPFLSLFSVMILIGTFALLLSLLLPSRNLAAMTAGILLVASYFITSLAQLDENLKEINRFSPLYYYQGGYAVEGLKWSWFAGLLLVSALFVLLAWWRFERRDIRVGGEGGWRLPRLSLKRNSPEG